MILGSAESWSPEPVPFAFALRWSIYCLAASERGKAGGALGISPPFWRRNSAMGKAGSFLFAGEELLVLRGDSELVDEDGG